ncbi:MAG: hypothetical protein ABIU29_00235 [Chthoniobacterales bacterium]
MKVRLLLAAVSLVLLSTFAPLSADADDGFYYWVTPRAFPVGSVAGESFVIQVSAEQSAQIEEIRSMFGIPGFAGHLAAGSVDYNRDYFAPGQPIWNWHVQSVETIFDFTKTVFPACQCPYLIAQPSEIAADPAAWIASNGDSYTPIFFQINVLVDPAKPAALANVSNRAFTGAGEKVAITGFIVTGSQPRNVIVRALGPSLAAQGVDQVVLNPQLEVRVGAALSAQNTDWKSDSRAEVITASFPALAPNDEREAALFLTLLPGAYTVLTSSEEGAEGIVLTEVYDALPSP